MESGKCERCGTAYALKWKISADQKEKYRAIKKIETSLAACNHKK